MTGNGGFLLRSVMVMANVASEEPTPTPMVPDVAQVVPTLQPVDSQTGMPLLST